MNKSLFFSLVLLMGGCSQVERIGADSEAIRLEASDTINRLEVITEANDLSVIVGEAKSAIKNQEQIISYASSIQLTLPNVRDATPWWANMIDRAVIALSILGVAFLVWHLGIGHLIKKMFWSIGLFIPSGAVRSAELDLKIEQKSISSSEAVAARRGGDLAYEAARKKISKQRGLDL